MISVSYLPIFLLFCHKGADLSRKAILDDEPHTKLQKSLSFGRRVLRNDTTNKEYDNDVNYDFLRACPSTITYDCKTNWFSL